MPWQGWNEAQVRGKTQPAATTPMAGFTPINASSSGTITRSDGRDGSKGASDRQHARTVASDYLGRDEDLPAAPPPKTTNTTKGKKRSATAGDTANTKKKRRQSSNIDDSLNVTKSHAQGQQFDKSNDTDKPQKPSKPKKKTTAKQSKKTPATVGTNNADEGALATKPVSVYAPATSMDALDSTSARTSFDSVKANAGQSFTLYQGPSSTASLQSSVEFSQPWLNSASNKARRTSKEKANGTRNALATPQTSDDYDVLSEDDITRDQPATAPSPSKRGVQHDGQSSIEQVKDSANGTRRSVRPKKAVNYAVEKSFPTIDLTEDVQQDADDRAATYANRRRATADDDDDFGEMPVDEAMELVEEVEEAVEEHRPTTPPPRGRKHNMREVDEHEDYGGALLSEAGRKLLAKMKNASEGRIKPIVRKPFQPAILDRSPVFGASNSTVLRTSFRIGEALNFGAQAVRCNNNVIIELFARATISRREGRKQHFVFKDLYHDKPPYLEGTYELWDQARLWDLDSKPFLKARGPGILSRVIARMKREGQKWRLDILNVWEASWDDVNYVAGIYTGEVQEEDEEDI